MAQNNLLEINDKFDEKTAILISNKRYHLRLVFILCLLVACKSNADRESEALLKKNIDDSARAQAFLDSAMSYKTHSDSLKEHSYKSFDFRLSQLDSIETENHSLVNVLTDRSNSITATKNKIRTILLQRKITDNDKIVVDSLLAFLDEKIKLLKARKQSN